MASIFHFLTLCVAAGHPKVVCKRFFLRVLGFWCLTHLRTEEAAFLVHLPSPFPFPVSILLTYTLLSFIQFVTPDNILLEPKKVKALQVSPKSPALGMEVRSVPPTEGNAAIPSIPSVHPREAPLKRSTAMSQPQASCFFIQLCTITDAREYDHGAVRVGVCRTACLLF